MRAAADANGLAVISEVMDARQIEMMLRYVDCLQVGARNMQNFDLLKELGKVRRPVLLKRGLSATIEEWLLCGGVHPGGRQRPGDPVRARHPHLRERHAQHARHLGGPGDQEPQPPADRGGPEPRHRAAARR